ncbi:Maf family protein [Myxococcota bacterium]|nr:Maf family protein [Myxococcota bacterium]
MLLEAAGVALQIVVPHVDESILPGERPIPYGLRVATKKAEAVVGNLVLAADTVVALDGEILAKAADVEDAVRMLTMLSGRTHTVHTAVVVRAGARLLSDVVSTSVRFRVLTEREIRAYVASGEPMDKAGAYGIQGLGGALVADVRGSYTNVVGLPLEETLALVEVARVSS